MTFEVGDQIIAMRKDGHWCQATVQSIGTFDVVTIFWEDGMTGDVKKSQGLLRPMGKISGPTCPRGVTYGGVKGAWTHEAWDKCHECHIKCAC